MWNNIPPANTNMNKFECLMMHKGHLERLAQARKVINTKKPKTPSFYLKGFKNVGIRKERALKIQYENKVLFDRMCEITKKYSPYSACLNIPSQCPAYELLSYHRLKKNNVLTTENNKLYKRFTFTKPTLNTDRLNKEYQYNKYLENNISQNKNRVNPNLDFIEFSKFNKRIRNFSSTFRKNINNVNLNLDNSLRNSKSLYEINRDIIIPSLTTNNNQKNNIEWFNKTENDTNIEDNNLIDFKEKLNVKRPNSSKPTAIIINREIQNSSNVFNSDFIGNSSYKTHRNKPASGKTRTNGSYSTNIMTSS